MPTEIESKVSPLALPIVNTLGDTLMTVEQAAQRLGVNTKSVYRFIHAPNGLTGERIGHLIFLYVDEVEAFANNREMQGIRVG